MANEFRRVVGLCAGAAILLNLAGCAGLLATMKPKVTAVATANPLEGGGVLRASRPPLDGSLGGSPTQAAVRPNDCTRWPVEDTYVVSVRGDSLCLDVTRTLGTGADLKDPTMADASFHEPKLLLATDTGRAPAMSLAPQRGASKVSQCHFGGQVYDVWSRTFSACTSNASQLLTPRSQWLAVQRNSLAGEIDEARWTFPATSRTVVTSAAGPSTSASASASSSTSGAVVPPARAASSARR